jgi:hypothetical protein
MLGKLHFSSGCWTCILQAPAGTALSKRLSSCHCNSCAPCACLLQADGVGKARKALATMQKDLVEIMRTACLAQAIRLAVLDMVSHAGQVKHTSTA